MSVSCPLNVSSQLKLNESLSNETSYKSDILLCHPLCRVLATVADSLLLNNNPSQYCEG